MSESKKHRMTLYLTTDLIERLKNAVYWTPGLTISGTVEASVERVVTALEKKNGGPFEPRMEKGKDALSSL